MGKNGAISTKEQPPAVGASAEQRVETAVMAAAPVLKAAASGASVDQDRLIQMITEEVIKQLQNK
jgi:hypothetical protein